MAGVVYRTFSSSIFSSRMSRYHRILSLYFLFLPFQFALSPWEGVDLAIIRPITLILVMFFILDGLVRRSLYLPMGFSAFFFSAFLCIASLSFFLAENTGFAFRKIGFLFSFLPLFPLLIIWLRTSAVARKKVLTSFVMGAALLSGTGLSIFFAQFIFGLEKIFSFLLGQVLPFFLGDAFAQSVAIHPSLLVNISGVTLLRASGVFPDPHIFSLFVALAVPFSLVLIFESTTQKMKHSWNFVFVLLLAGVFLSFSRGAYMALLGGGSIFLWLSGIFQHPHFYQKKKFFIPIFLLLLLLFTSPIGARFLSSFSGEDGSNKERLRLWQEAVLHISERPFLGVGLGNYSLLVHPEAAYRDPIYVHNLFLDLAVEIGLVGLFFFLGLLIFAMKGMYSQWKEEADWWALALFSSTIIFCIHSLFESPIYSVHILPVLILFLAIGVSYKYEKPLV